MEDPLVSITETETTSTYTPYIVKDFNSEQSKEWQTCHLATRLKLEGAAYFCRQVLGAASMPDDVGMSLLAHRQLKWYLDAFFFELMSAWDTLLQELNIVYRFNLDPEKVRWEKLKSGLPRELQEYIEREWQQEWFKKVRNYRNTAAHHRLVPTSESRTGSGSPSSLGCNEHKVCIEDLDEHGRRAEEEIKKLYPDYLKPMAQHIRSVWDMMKDKFQPLDDSN